MLRYLVKKEFLQIRRDRKMVPIVFFAPIVQLTILGYAASVDVDDIPAVVCDLDRTAQSRRWVDALLASGWFVGRGETADRDAVDRALDRGEADVGVVIPPGFGRAVAGGGSTTVQAIVNGSDSNVGGVGFNYLMQINARFSSRIMLERLAAAGVRGVPSVALESRVWYNPELRSRWFMVPAILSMILMIMTMMLTAMAVVREKEIGTMEQLIVTPVRSWQIIAGKFIPFAVIGLIDVTLVTAVAVFWFKVPLRGSLLALYATSSLFLLNTLGIGLLVSTLSHTQAQAIMTVAFFIMMPFVYLSGFIFPIENMPPAVQAVTYAIPMRYFIDIIRGLFLKGAGIDVLWKDAAALAAIGTGLMLVSIARFRKQL